MANGVIKNGHFQPAKNRVLPQSLARRNLMGALTGYGGTFFAQE